MKTIRISFALILVAFLVTNCTGNFRPQFREFDTTKMTYVIQPDRGDVKPERYKAPHKTRLVNALICMNSDEPSWGGTFWGDCKEWSSGIYVYLPEWEGWRLAGFRYCPNCPIDFKPGLMALYFDRDTLGPIPKEAIAHALGIPPQYLAKGYDHVITWHNCELRTLGVTWTNLLPKGAPVTLENLQRARMKDIGESPEYQKLKMRFWSQVAPKGFASVERNPDGTYEGIAVANNLYPEFEAHEVLHTIEGDFHGWQDCLEYPFVGVQPILLEPTIRCKWGKYPDPAPPMKVGGSR